MVWPLVSHPAPTVSDTLNAFDYLISAGFAFEYPAKLYLARNG
jgi:hypothetical protein